MRTYETIFVLNPELGTEAVEEQIEFYKDNITSNGGELLAVEPWGKLALAYKIDNYSEGIYVLIQFKADTKYIDELEVRYKYNEKVIRFVVVMIDEKKFKLKPRKETARKERKPRNEETSDVAFVDEDASQNKDTAKADTTESTDAAVDKEPVVDESAVSKE